MLIQKYLNLVSESSLYSENICIIIILFASCLYVYMVNEIYHIYV